MVTQDIELAIEAAVMLNPGMSTALLAHRIYDSEPLLMESVAKLWAIERLCWTINRKRRLSKQSVNQLVLPGFEGFERLPRRIQLKNGKRPDLSDATLGQLREFRAILWRKRDRRLAVIDRLIAMVSQHARRNRRLTVRHVVEIEKARQESI